MCERGMGSAVGQDPVALKAIVELADQGETPMAALRTIVSMLSGYEPNTKHPIDPTLVLQQGVHITAKMPTILAAFDRVRNGEEILPPRKNLSHAANFLYMLTGEEPDETKTNTFVEIDYLCEANYIVLRIIGASTPSSPWGVQI